MRGSPKKSEKEARKAHKRFNLKKPTYDERRPSDRSPGRPIVKPALLQGREVRKKGQGVAIILGLSGLRYEIATKLIVNILVYRVDTNEAYAKLGRWLSTVGVINF
ncbi:hypothetical protein IFM89_021105 [Coptis chinensis]|uniref:Uncharacterized protein n=1 Tax=Coptis chinensis TaxID=261450 RepID=A0A835HNJ4_9MAGN|nr:hypothetical protein IFM89_021105 [Coptis chinensis]